MVSVSFISGVLTGAVATVLAVFGRRAFLMLRRGRPALLAAAAVAAFALASALLYFTVAARQGASGTPTQATSGGTAAQSMQEAVAGLEARLARGGGTDADWELLARAYDFLGRPEEARRARAHQSGTVSDPASGPAPGAVSVEALMAAADSVSRPGASGAVPTPTAAGPSPVASLDVLRQRAHDHPKDADGWLALADLARAQHDNQTAREALERLIALNAMSAQSWADYADVLASGNGGLLSGAAGKAIDQALTLDPASAKALWLKASQAHEQHRFAQALSWWQKLRAVLPADSPDVRIIDGNIAEDTQLLGAAPATRAVSAQAAQGTDTGTAAAGAQVSGTVSIDGRLAARVQPDATLFIYAKAADSPGPPLAVLRTTAAAWPVAFRLDDTMAMLPSRRLSQFEHVVVEARISRSGQATPGSGDLFVTSPVVSPGAASRLALVIDREVQ